MSSLSSPPPGRIFTGFASLEPKATNQWLDLPASFHNGVCNFRRGDRPVIRRVTGGFSFIFERNK
jgi:hypothetical protein